MNKLFIPINECNAHWTLMVVFVSEKRIRHFDSLGFLHGFTSIKKYLCKEYSAKHGQSLDIDSWKCSHEVTPKQPDKHNCGVYVSMIGDFMFDNLPISASSFGTTTDEIKRNLIHFRYRISHAIIKGQIFYEEPPNRRGRVTKLLTLLMEDFQHQSPAPESLSPSAILVGSIGAPAPVTTATVMASDP